MRRRLLILLLFFCAATQSHADPSFLTVQSGPRGDVRALAISPDKTRLAVLSADAIQLYTREGSLIWSCIIYGDPQALTWRPDGKAIAVGVGGTADYVDGKPGASAGAWELDASKGNILRKLLDDNNTVYGLVYLPDGNLQVTYSWHTVYWDVTGKMTKNEPTSNPIFPAPDAYKMAVLTTGVQIWDRALTSKQASLWKKGMPMGAFAWSPDSLEFAVSNGDYVQVWNAQTRKIEHEITLPHNGATFPSNYHRKSSIIWGKEGDIFIAQTDFPDYKDISNEQPYIGKPRSFLWHVNLKTGSVETLRNGARLAINALAMWPDGTLVLGGADNHDPQIWNGTLFFVRVKNGALQTLWGAPPALRSINRLRISPDGKMLAVASDDTAIRLWDLKSAALQKTLKTYSSEIIAIAWSPDGNRMAAIDFDHLFVFDVASGKAQSFKGMGIFSRDGDASIAWSPDGKQIAFSGGIGIRILQISTGKERELDSDSSGPLRWTNQGLESTLRNGYVRLLDPQNGKELRDLNAKGTASEVSHDGAIIATQFFDNGQKLWTLGGDEEISRRTVKLWDVPNNRVERTLHDIDNLSSIALSPDEKILLTGNKTGEIEAKDVVTLKTIFQIETSAPVRDMVWSAAGDAIFVAGADGRVRVYTSDGALQATLIALPELDPKKIGCEWIDFTPKSTFMASGKALAQVRWRQNGKLLPLVENQRVKTISLSNSNIPLHPKMGLIAVSTQPSKAPSSPEKTTSEKPMLIIQGLGKGDSANALAISPNARWVVSLNGEDGLTLWDGKDGLEWGNLPIPNRSVPLFFSPDSTLLFCAHILEDGRNPKYDNIEIRRIPSGELVQKIDMPAPPLWGDEKIMRWLQDGAVVTYDISTKIITRRQKIDGLIGAYNFSFSPNGQFLIGPPNKDNTAHVWRVNDGKQIAKISDKLRVIGQTAVSNDGRLIATEGDDPNWSPPTDGPMTEASYARTFRVHIWDTKSGKLLHTYPGFYSLSGGAESLRFSDDGRTLFGIPHGGAIHKFDLTSNKTSEVPPLISAYNSPAQGTSALSIDAKWMVTTLRNASFGIYETATARQKIQFPGMLSAPSKIWWSPDGRYLLGGTALVLFDAKTGKLLSHADNSYARESVWTGNEIITANSQNITRWKILPLEKIDEWQIGPKRKEAINGYSDGIHLSPDGKIALTFDPKGVFGGGGNGLFVWDVQTHQLKRQMIPDMRPSSSDLDKIIFTPQNKSILRGTSTGLELWSLETGEKLKEWRDLIDPNFTPQYGQNSLLPLAVSGDGKLVAVRAMRDQSTWIFPLQSDEEPLHLLTKSGYHAQFLNDNYTLLLDSQTGLEEWDANGDGKTPLRQLGFGGEWSLSPDHKTIAFGGRWPSGSAVILNFPTMKKKVQLFLTGNYDSTSANSLGWIVLTPGGYYDASVDAEKHLRWRDQKYFWPLQKSHEQFYNPEKVQEALR